MSSALWLDTSFWGNALSRWLLAFGVFVAVLALVWCLLWLVRVYLRRFSESTAIVLDDLVVAVLGKTKTILIALVAARSALAVLQVPEWLSLLVHRAAMVALLLQIGIWISAGMNAWIADYRESRTGEGEVATWLEGIAWGGRVVIWSMVFLACLENLGVDITGLATGLGITGIAVALAVQNILGDLFASFSIYFDRPFVLGDSLAVGDDLGKVESIGLKTTRLRSPSGEQLVISNADLLESRIRNYGRMEERRVVFELRIAYDTEPSRIEALPGMIREIVESQDAARFVRSHLKKLGEDSLEVETVYFMRVADYQIYMDTHQAINLALLRRLELEGIEVALPTRTVQVEQREEDRLAGG